MKRHFQGKGTVMATRKKSAPKGRGGQSGGVENELVDEARSISRYHARETRSTDRLSPHLHDAYEWIASAGEWEDALSSPEQYASDAAANAAEHGYSDITESDLLDVIEWFSGQRKRNSHARETRSTDRLSPHLHDAYEWIASAGEWEDALSSPEQYASDAAANAAEHGHSDITESDLLDVIEWFSGQRKRNSHAREHTVRAPRTTSGAWTVEPGRHLYFDGEPAVGERRRNVREGERGYFVMKWGGGTYTSVGWYSTRQEAEKEVARIKASGRWSGKAPKIEAAGK